MVDTENFSRRLDALESYLGRLRSLGEAAEPDYLAEPGIHDLAARYLHLAVEAAIEARITEGSEQRSPSAVSCCSWLDGTWCLPWCSTHFGGRVFLKLWQPIGDLVQRRLRTHEDVLFASARMPGSQFTVQSCRHVPDSSWVVLVLREQVAATDTAEPPLRQLTVVGREAVGSGLDCQMLALHAGIGSEQRAMKPPAPGAVAVSQLLRRSNDTIHDRAALAAPADRLEL